MKKLILISLLALLVCTAFVFPARVAYELVAYDTISKSYVEVNMWTPVNVVGTYRGRVDLFCISEWHQYWQVKGESFYAFRRAAIPCRALIRN